MESSALGGELGLAKFLMCGGKISFECRPCSVRCEASTPISTCVVEDSSLEDGIVGVDNNLGLGIFCLRCGRKVDGIFDLIKQNFDWL